MIFINILFSLIFFCSNSLSIGQLKCNVPQKYGKSGLYLYSKEYFGACDKLKQMFFCSMPFSNYYIKNCELNNHKCKCEEAFKRMVKNQVPFSEKDTKEIINYYDSVADDGTSFPSDILNNDYFYGDY